MTKKEKKKMINLVGAIILLIIGSVFGLNLDEMNVDTNIEEGSYLVTRVVDGDTIEIDYNGVKEKVRLIGVDTPESVHPDKSKNTEEGEIASNYTKELLLDKYIKLEFDVGERDNYGRMLVYMYIEDKMVNKILLEEGYARLSTVQPNVKYVDEFTEIQKQAREQGKGFWNTTF